MKIKTPEKQAAMEKAIIMLVECVKENCSNPKPVILHSLRVGLGLLDLDQPQNN